MIFNRVLFLGAHPDDEFGCSGTLAKFLEEDKNIYYAVFSLCEESVPEGFPKDILSKELIEATKTLGIKQGNLFIYNFRVRHFPANRQDILEKLVVLREELQPDLILLPALSDVHQDHHIIAMEGLRAFKYCSIFGYELPMNTISFQHACFIKLEERHVAKKIESLMCYKSQSFRNYSNVDFIRGLARVRGVQIGEEYAEAFEVIRLKL